MAEVKIFMSGDDERVRAMHERLLRDQQKLLDKYKEVGGASKKLSDEEIAALQQKADEEKAFQKLQERAVKNIKDVTTAHEDYSTKLKDAVEQRKKGLLTDEQYSRVMARLKQELRDNTGVTQRLAQAQKDQEATVAKATATTQKYMTTVEKLQAELADVRAQYDRNEVSLGTLQRAQKRLNDEQQKTADPSAFKSLIDGAKNYASGLAVVSTTLGVIRATWEQIRKEQEAGASAMKGTQASDQKLLQVSASPQEFQQLTAQADTMSQATGVDRSVARDVLFQAVSEGFRDVVPEIVAANQVLPPQAAAGVAGQVPALFKGQIQAMEAVSMTLKAAELSRLDFEPLARALPQAVEGGAIAKATPEETMATLSVLASRFKSGEVAGDRIKAFTTKVGIDTGSVDAEYEDKLKREKERASNAAKDLRSKEEHVADLEKRLASGKLTRDARPGVETQLERAKRAVSEFDRTKLDVDEPKRTKPTRKSIQGMGIIRAVEELNAMTEEQRQEFLGESQELNTAYIILKEELDTIKSQEAILKKERADRKAGGGSLREKVAIAAADPKQRALKQEAIAQRSLEITQAEEKGVEGLGAAGATADAQRMLLKQDALPARVVGSVTAPVATGVASAVGADQETSGRFGVRVTRAIAAGNTNPLFPAGMILELFKPVVDSQKAAADSMNEAAKKMDAAASKNDGAANKLNQRVLPTVDQIRAQQGRLTQ